MTFRDPMDGSDDDAPVFCDHGVDITRDECAVCDEGISASPSPAVDETEEPADEDPFW